MISRSNKVWVFCAECWMETRVKLHKLLSDELGVVHQFRQAFFEVFFPCYENIVMWLWKKENIPGTMENFGEKQKLWKRRNSEGKGKKFGRRRNFRENRKIWNANQLSITILTDLRAQTYFTISHTESLIVKIA